MARSNAIQRSTKQVKSSVLVRKVSISRSSWSSIVNRIATKATFNVDVNQDWTLSRSPISSDRIHAQPLYTYLTMLSIKTGH